jgi:hypothetical protein
LNPQKRQHITPFEDLSRQMTVSVAQDAKHEKRSAFFKSLMNWAEIQFKRYFFEGMAS